MGGLLPVTGYNKNGIVSSKLSVYLPNYTVNNNTEKEKYIKILSLTSGTVCLYLSIYSTRVDSYFSHVEVEIYRHSTSDSIIKGAYQVLSKHSETYTPKFYIDKQNNDLYMSLKEYMSSTIFIRAMEGDVSGILFDCATETGTIEGFTLLTSNFQWFNKLRKGIEYVMPLRKGFLG